MGIGTGMRGKDLRAFCMVARQYGVYILVRHTNEASLKYVGKAYFTQPRQIGVPMVVNEFSGGEFKTLFVGKVE